MVEKHYARVKFQFWSICVRNPGEVYVSDWAVLPCHGVGKLQFIINMKVKLPLVPLLQLL